MSARHTPYFLRRKVVNQNGFGSEGETEAPRRPVAVKKYVLPKKPQQYTTIEPTEYWTANSGVSFEQWIKDKWGNERDPAMGYLYNKWWPVPPLQCKFCRENGRYIEYDANTDITRIIYELCQACRYRGLKLASMEYKFFKAEDDEAEKAKQ